MKRSKIYKILVVCLVFSGFFIHNINNIAAAETSDVDNFAYKFIVDYRNGTEQVNFDTKLDMTVNHNGFEFPGNGTIAYKLEDNITDDLLIDSFGMFIGQDLLSYFTDHSPDEEIQMHHFGRIESNSSTIGEDSYYSIFWLKGNVSEVQDLGINNNVKFLTVEHSWNIGITSIRNLYGWNSFKIISGRSYLSPQTIECFQLSLEVKMGDLELNMFNYYDREFGILISSSVDYRDEEDGVKTSGELQIYLIDTTLPINTSVNIPFYVISLTILIGVCIIIILIYKRRFSEVAREKQKKIDAL